MKTRNILFILFALIISVGCDRTDFDEILRRQANQQSTIDDHEARIKVLETLVTATNNEIVTIQGLIKALEGKVSVDSYSELTDKSGYELLMSDGSKILLKHGDKGDTGSTPSVNVKMHTDGLLYWTLNSEFMLDGNGKMILAQGIKGDDGVNGETPQMRVNSNNEWEVSLDNGTTWQTVKDNNGDTVKATGETGSAGPTGPQGPQGLEGEANLTITETDNAIIIIYNGVTYTIPKGEGVSYMTLTINEHVGPQISIYVEAPDDDQDDCWIDLNNNGTRDPDEDLVFNTKWVFYTIETRNIVIYGDITYLGCNGTLLTELDVSKNKKLSHLECNGSKLTKLDISKNRELEQLWCRSNQFTELDVSKNKKLRYLDCEENQFEAAAITKIITDLPMRTYENNARVFFKDNPALPTAADVAIGNAKNWIINPAP